MVGYELHIIHSEQPLVYLNSSLYTQQMRVLNGVEAMSVSTHLAIFQCHVVQCQVVPHLNTEEAPLVCSITDSTIAMDSQPAIYFNR